MPRSSLTVSTDRRLEVIDITQRVDAALDDEYAGPVTVFARHTTTGLTVNEAESRLLEDFETALRNLVDDGGWKHDTLDGNADSHIRSMLLGPSETVPVVDGRLDMGTWQSLLFVECDGPRERTVDVLW